MNTGVKGTIAGLVATVPMTLAMEAVHDQLPPHEQYSLPPRLITERVTADADTGLLPTVGILRPAIEQPPRRTAPMIAPHVVWGGVLGALAGGGRKKIYV